MGHIAGGLLRQPPAPTTEELLDKFEREGILRVPARDGTGFYTFVLGRNIKHYPVTLYWSGFGHGTTVHNAFDIGYGGQLAYSVPGGRWGSVRPRCLVEILLQFIESGRLIHMNDCGATIGVGFGV